MNILDTHIQKVSKKTAHNFFTDFEILGNVGLGVWHWGLWGNNNLVSVVSFGTTCFSSHRGWLSNVAKKFEVKVFQLCRGGTLPNAPTGIPSRAISLASKEMREQFGPFLSVAYADDSLGEIGTIYQACGAIYTGKTNPKGQANYVINGKFKSGWQVRKQYGTRDRKKLEKIESNIEIIKLEPKHRYLFITAPKILRRRIIKDIQKYAQGYPKREDSTEKIS